VLFEIVTEFLAAYWEQVVTLGTLCIVLVTYWRARSVWKSRHFMTRVNFTLNYVEAGRLKIRTLGETDLDPNQRHRFMEIELALSADPS